MLILHKKIGCNINIKPNEEDKTEEINGTVESFIERNDSYPKAIAKSFLGFPVTKNWTNIEENMKRHITKDNRKLFIPVVYESSRDDKYKFKGLIKSNVTDPKSCPAQYYMESITEGNIQSIIEANKYNYNYSVNISDKLKKDDYITEMCTDNVYFYNHRNKKIYGFDESEFAVTTEGMNISQFMKHCQDDYRRIVQEYFNQFPDVIEEASKNIKTQTSYMTGVKIDFVNDLFTIEGFNDFLLNYIKTKNTKNYTKLSVSLESINISHRNAIKKIKNVKCGPIFKIKEYYVTPSINHNGTELNDIYLVMVNENTKDIDYIPLNINSSEALEMNKKYFQCESCQPIDEQNDFDDDGIITIEGFNRLFNDRTPIETIENPEVIKSIIEYFEINTNAQNEPFPGVVREDIVDGARKIAHGVKSATSSVGGAAHKVGKAASELVKPLVSKINNFLEENKKDREDESREIVITDNTFMKIKRFFREVMAPTYLVYAIKGPVLGLIALLVSYYKSSNDKQTKAKVLRELEEELKITREKIEDAKSDNARKEKYQLMRIESKLEDEIAKIKTKDI